MKVILATHHFLPRYMAGAELYAYRVARWLQDHDHTVAVVCVESITDGDGTLRVEREDYEGLAVYRLYFNLARTPDPFRWSYWNPDIGAWLEGFLREQSPDVLHVNSGYLLSASVIQAGRAADVPVVLTLHDYWFLCPRLHLQRPNGTLTVLPNRPAECAWCLMTEKRRYRLPDVASGGRIGRLATAWLERRRSPRVQAIEERRRVLKEALGQVTAFVAPSRFLRDIYIGEGLPPERFSLIRHGLDMRLWRQDIGVHRNSGNSEKLAGTQDSPLRIGYLGQLEPHKGVHVLIEAFRRLSLPNREGRDARLTIYGDMNRNAGYVRRLRQLANGEPRIVFAGAYDNRRVAEVLSSMDVCAMPSMLYENSPTVILEARASGVPVITTDLGGMAEMVRHDVDGLLFRPGDADDLARQLQRLLDEPDLLPRLRANAPPVMTIEEQMQALMEVYTAASREQLAVWG